MQYKCPKCGNMVEEGTKFCPSCGQPFNWPEKEPEPVVMDAPVAAPQQPIVQQPVVQQPVMQPTFEQPIQQPVENKKGGKLKKGCLGCGIALLIPFLLLIIIGIASTDSTSSSSTSSTTSSKSASSTTESSDYNLLGTWDLTSSYMNGQYFKTTTTITFNSDNTIVVAGYEDSFSFTYDPSTKTESDSIIMYTGTATCHGEDSDDTTDLKVKIDKESKLVFVLFNDDSLGYTFYIN